MKVLSSVFFLFITSTVFAQSNWSALDSCELTTLNKKKLRAQSLKYPYTVFIFFAPDCPLSQKYTFPLQLIYDRYKTDVNFIGIFPGKWYTNSEFKKFQKSYRPSYKLVKDEKLKLTNYLNATVTPEVFLVNENGRVLYHGAIDNWVIKLGNNRKSANEHYLSEAISQALKKQVINPDFVNPVGCFIEK